MPILLGKEKIIMRQKLKKLIESGSDIEFILNGVMYTILPWTDQGILIGAQGLDENETFKTADELIDCFCVNGTPLTDLLDQLVITFSA